MAGFQHKQHRRYPDMKWMSSRRSLSHLSVIERHLENSRGQEIWAELWLGTPNQYIFNINSVCFPEWFLDPCFWLVLPLLYLVGFVYHDSQLWFQGKFQGWSSSKVWGGDTEQVISTYIKALMFLLHQKQCLRTFFFHSLFAWESPSEI